MNSSQRWVTVFGSIIGALIIITISLSFLPMGNADNLINKGTPQCVVQHFLRAIQDKNYSEAYDHFFDDIKFGEAYDHKYTNYIKVMQSIALATWEARISKATQSGVIATEVVFINICDLGKPD